MEPAAATTRSRRRKTPTPDGNVESTVEVVIETSPPSTSKLPSRTKRERKPNSSRDTVTPPPHADEPPRKMRTRRSPGKDAETANPKASKSFTAKQDEEDEKPVKTASSSTISAQDDDKPSHDDSDSDVIQVASTTKSGRSKRKADARDKTPPVPKRSIDLARELFNDDEQEKVNIAPAASTEANVSSSVDSGDVELAFPSRKRRRAGSDDSQLDSQPSSASFATAVEVEIPQVIASSDSTRTNATDAVSLQLRIRQLEIQLAETKAKADSNAGTISAQHSIFENLHGQCVCHICLEPSFRPCVLAPCGHVFCIHCLRSWFTKPLASEAPAPEGWSESQTERYNRSRTLKRKKICPSCRTELACPPVQVFLVRDMLEKVDEGLKLSKEADVDSQLAESSTAILGQDDKARSRGEDLPKGAKLWEGIFDEDGPRRIIFDEMDGVPRCGSCGSEIFDGQCSNPSCGIEYDSHSDYEDLRRGGWDDMDDSDSDHGSEDDNDGFSGGPRRARRNGALAGRLADFEARHGRSEGLHGRNRLELPDDFTGITYIDSSGNERVVVDDTEEDRERRAHYNAREGDEDIDEDDEDDEEMDDFIVRDDFEDEEDRAEMDDFDEPNYFDGTASEDEGPGRYPGDSYGDFDDEEEDDFLPGPRRGGRGSAIEISDDEDVDEDGEERDSSVEYRDRRGGRVVDDEDSEVSRSGSESLDEVEHHNSEDDEEDDDDDEGERDGYLGSSTDSSVRRRRARIIDDDEDEDEDEVDEDDL